MGMSAWPIRVVHRVGGGWPAYLIDFEDPDFQGAREGYANALQGFTGFKTWAIQISGILHTYVYLVWSLMIVNF